MTDHELVFFRPRNYTPLAMRRAVQQFRQDKNFAKSDSLTLTGQKGYKLTEHLLRTDSLIDIMAQKHQEWINSKIASLDDYLKGEVPQDTNLRSFLTASYRKGASKALMQEFRLYKNNIDKNVSTSDFRDAELEDRIVAYGFDFYRLLTVSKKIGLTPGVAIKLAESGYWNNPDVIVRLSADPRYSNLKPNVITVAATHNITDPEGFLDKFIIAVDRLSNTPRFLDIKSTAIQRAAANYPDDPEGFLDGFIKKVDELSNDMRYIGVNPSVINTAALNHSADPEGFLDAYIETLNKLIGDTRYANLGPNAIGRAVIGYRKPEAFLDNYIKTLDKLAKDDRYKDLNPSVIKAAAFHNSKNPEGFLDEYKATVERLSKNPIYFKLGATPIAYAAIGHSKDPEGFLDEFITTVKRLNGDSRYSGLNRNVLETFAIRHLKNAEKYLDRYKAMVKKYSEDERYKNVNPSVILIAATSYPRDPEGFLNSIINKTSVDTETSEADSLDSLLEDLDRVDAPSEQLEVI